VSEPPAAASPEPGSRLCARHGLRFDPATQDGCVLCRRERSAAAPAAPSRIDSVGAGWLVAALLWIATGLALSSLHEIVLASFAGLASGGVPAAEAPVIGPALEQEVDSGLEALRRDSADADPGWDATVGDDGGPAVVDEADDEAPPYLKEPEPDSR